MIDTEYLNIIKHNSPSESSEDFYQKSTEEKIYDWNFAGAPVMLALITILQYIFQISNNSPVVGIFAPVNDSISEILKQAFWAMAIFSAIEHTQIKNYVNNYIVAKLFGLIALVGSIVTLHYSLDLLLGFNNIILNAIPFIAGVAVCQVISYSVYQKPPYKLVLSRIAVVAIILIAVSFEAPSIHTGRNSLLSISNIHISQNTISK